MDRYRGEIGLGSFDMVGKGIGMAVVGAVVTGALRAGSEGEGNESNDICSSLAITSFPFSFFADLGS